MSTNIHFFGEREVQVIKTGKINTQEISFNEWQTPSDVTRKIMASADPVQAYKDWILSQSNDRIVNVFAEDDVFSKGEPIGVEIYNAGKEHVEKFEEWLKMCEEEGYDVRAEAW